MARRGGALTHYVERIDLCAHWWPGRSADHVVTGANRWRAQLGLSLLLVTRCSPDFARVTPRGVPGGSHFLAPMAIARHSRQPCTNANDLRRSRRTPTY